MKRTTILTMCVCTLIFSGRPASGGTIYATDPASVNAGNYSAANIPGLGAGDVLGPFSFGYDPIIPNLYFTVDRQAIGAPGTAVADLSDPAVDGGANGDVFYSAGGSATNSLYQYGTTLGLSPGFFGDDITGLSLLPQVDNVYFALGPGSPTLAALGVSAADILMSGPGGLRVFARPTTFGLTSKDQLSGLVLDASADTALFTISSFSADATTSGGTMDPSDVYETTFNGSNTIYRTGADLGLLPGDQIQDIATTTPEPSTFGLLLTACLLIFSLKRRRAGHALLLAAAAVIPLHTFAAETCSTMAGKSPPNTNSAGTLILPDLTTKNFRWVSNDAVFGAVDTGVVAANTFTVSNGTPPRVVFTGTANGINFQGNVLLGNYQRGTVNLYTANKQISYLIAPPTFEVTNVEFDWKSPAPNKTDPTAAITMRRDLAEDLDFARPPAGAANMGPAYGEWGNGINEPALYVANQMVTIKVRFTTDNQFLLAADISAKAQNGLIPNVKSTTVNFTAQTAEYIQMPFDRATDAFINKVEDTWVWQLGNVNGCGTPVTAPAQPVTSGPHTLYTVLGIPTSPWYDIDAQWPWLTALDFVTGPVNLIRAATVATAAATTTNFLFTGYTLIYDSAGGRPNYVFTPSTAPRFNLTGFIANPRTCNTARPCSNVNCYDMAASAATFINLIGGNSAYRYMQPNGYMATEALIGRGNANNPFFLITNAAGAFVYQQPQLVGLGCENTIVGGKIGRSSFGNHAFVTLPGDLSIDAMGGPYTGTMAIPAYLLASIDANAMKAAGVLCTDIGTINPVTMKGSDINGGPGDVRAAVKITLQ